MRKKLFVPSLLAVLITAMPFFGAVTTYETDANHSNVGFSIPIAGGLSHVRGKFTDFKVTIVYDDKDLTKSSVNAIIKTASIDTGVERRDAHLRTPDFFDAEKTPEINFKSTRVVKKGKNFIAYGTFTMHGVSKEIALPFTINGVNKDAKTGKTTLGLTARTSISKKEFGMTWAQPANPTFLGDMVEIELNIITRAASPQ
jgi:polyisoprenoid-binding protein YceI